LLCVKQVTKTDTHTPPLRPRRDAARTRAAILDAAEGLFAERGYEAVSLSEVGEAAGVSRGTPGYFFGNKEGLYRAVLDRTISASESLVERLRALSLAGASADEVIEQAISGYIDLLAARPTYVRLVQWETLKGGRFLGGTTPHVTAIEGAREVLAAQLARSDAGDQPDLAQMLVSILGLCWFPFAHADTALRTLGLEARDPDFIAARKRHVLEVVRRAMGLASA
jgi:TetR/AcrR family transcriptional regulator